jgi:hypothetical protein
MTSSNFRLIGSEVDCFKKLVYETFAIVYYKKLLQTVLCPFFKKPLIIQAKTIQVLEKAWICSKLVRVAEKGDSYFWGFSSFMGVIRAYLCI